MITALLLVAAASLPPRDSAIAEQFCTAMTSGRLREFATVAGSITTLSDMSWLSVRNLVEQYDCISVASYDAHLDDATNTLVIDVDATGITRNGKHERRTIPARWYLHLDSTGKVVGADDDVTRVAQLFLHTLSDDERARIADEHRELLPKVARLITSEAARLPADARLATEKFLFEWSLDHHDLATESYALSALAFFNRASDRAAAQQFAEVARVVAQSVDCDATSVADWAAAYVVTDRARREELLIEAGANLDDLDDPRDAFQAAYEHGNKLIEDVNVAAATRTLEQMEQAARRLDCPVSELNAEYGKSVVESVVDHPDGGRHLLHVAEAANAYGAANIAGRAWAAVGIMEAPADAIVTHQKALEVLPRSLPALRSYSYAFLAAALARVGRVREASAQIDPALEAAHENSLYMMHVLWAAETVRHAEGRFKEAIEFAHAAIRWGNESPLYMTWNIKGELGQILIECGEREEGMEMLRDSIDLIEARRALTTSSPIVHAEYMRNRTSMYTSLADALVDEKRYDEALEISERIKARSMEDAVADHGEPLPLTADEKSEERTLNERIVDLNRAIIQEKNPEAEAKLREQLRTARGDLDSFHVTMELHHTRGLAQTVVQDSEIPRNVRGTVIEYTTAEATNITTVYVVHGGHIYAQHLPAGSREITEATKLLVKQLDERDLDAASSARALYKMLVAPIERRIPREGEITIVPDDFLWNVPFHLLRNRNGRYLIQDHAIAYAPSLKMLDAAQTHERSDDRKTLLALGDPYIGAHTSAKAATYRNLHLGALPDAKLEVRAIGSLYGQQQSTVVTGSDARESLLKQIARRYRIIHLATHGIVDDDSPLYSALVLATKTNDPDDGLLEMREISDLHLNADLVVLSACETARGAVFPGEGVIGLSWAFLSAGCPTTVVSQWKTDSRSSSLLMIEFHRQLKSGKSIAEALRQAELKLLNTARYRHPFYWAPFIVVGRSDPLPLRR